MTEIVTHYNYEYQDIARRIKHDYSITTYAGADVISGSNPVQPKNFTASGYEWNHTSESYDNAQLYTNVTANDGCYTIISREETDTQGNLVTRWYYSTPSGEVSAPSNAALGYVLRWQQLYSNRVQGQIVPCYVDASGTVGHYNGYTATVSVSDADVDRIAGINYKPSNMYSVKETITEE